MKEAEGRLMPQEEFEEYIGVGQLKVFDTTKRFRHVKRAIKRGHTSPLGEVYPRRPFNNRKSTPGRKFNKDRRDIYEQIKHRGI